MFKTPKKWAGLLAAALSAALLLTGCTQPPASAVSKAPSAPAPSSQVSSATRVGVMKGPTGMGLVDLMDKAEKGVLPAAFAVNVYGTADEILPKLLSGELDIAALPANVAAVLYNKSEGKIELLNLNTLGVLHLFETGDTIKTLQDLKGKTIYTTGKGTTPDFALQYLLGKSGLAVGKDVQVEFKTEATEVAAMLAGGQNMVALLPEPYATAVELKNPKARRALSLSAEWDKLGGGSGMVTGVTVVRKEFKAKNPAAVEAFVAAHRQSVEFVNKNPAEAAALIGKYAIAAPEVAAKAIPGSNLVCITGAEAKEKLAGYLSVLFAQNPQSVGGKLPDDGFYGKTGQ